MWSSTLARRSAQPLLRATPKQSGLVSSWYGFDGLATRSLSSDDRGNNNNRRGSGGQRRGGGNNRRGNQASDARSNPNHGRRPKKQNYSDEFLKPAARGELKNHHSTVPKLAGRRPKGHGLRGADPDFRGLDDELEMIELNDQDAVTSVTLPKEEAPRKVGTIKDNSPVDQLNHEEATQLQQFYADYQLMLSSARPELYYWSEADFDRNAVLEKSALFLKLRSEATKDEEDNYVVEVDDATFAMFDECTPVVEEKPKVEEDSPPPMRRFNDPGVEFVVDAMGIEGADKPHPADYDQILPLQLQGPTIQDFVMSMMKHPAKYGEVRWSAPNAESDREPVPDFPANRQGPSEEFVEANKRFMYVWGLPPKMASGSVRDLDNPLDCLDLQNMVGELFQVPIEQVSVASPTSAFVGFPLVEDQVFATEVGPISTYVEGPVSISKCDEGELAEKNPGTVVLLENLPLGYSPSILAQGLFPVDSEVGHVYGNLSADKIVMLSPTSAAVVMESKEKAEQALTSEIVQERLAEIGQHRVRYAKARRELVYTGKHGGPDRTEALRTLGPRLIVDGDMPTKSFYISHASSFYLRNLDPSVTKEQIAAFFQPFCSVPRDVQGSTEFITCCDGMPTGRAYVGFDEIGEAMAAWEALTAAGGRIEGLGPSSVVAKQVKDLVSNVQREQRSARSEEELLDSLNNWHQYVDPADMEELIKHDISMEALDETFRAIRYHNTTFASMDQAMRNETINPEMDAGGMYKELVQTYIATLKECLSTPENPGPIYQSLVDPDEEIDTEFFDMEAERLEELRKRREMP
eukprot:Nitzschia sp. Nitz4//scaffold51_size120721//68924//71341//NITZ4_003735-RA/size120721-processed-gene-0.157-mRNA-1//-1//CDS//3329553886//637//frame0